VQTANGSSDGGSATVSGLDPVNVDIVVCKNGTSHGSNTDSGVFEAELVKNFGYQFVNDAMAATGAVVSVDVEQQSGAAVGFIFGFDDFFGCHG
jgi:hypothetical protein